MKNIIWIFSFAFFIKCIHCNYEILSKFHQTGYKLKDTRIQLMSYDKNVYNNFEIKAFKYNRTTTAHNVTFNAKVNATDQVEVIVQCNKFLSNEFRHFPVRFQINVVKAFKSNAIGLGSFKNCGNLTNFYVYKDVTYHGCNFVIDETRFPPLMPNGQYRVDLSLLYLNRKVALIHMYTEVYIHREKKIFNGSGFYLT